MVVAGEEKAHAWSNCFRRSVVPLTASLRMAAKADGERAESEKEVPYPLAFLAGRTSSSSSFFFFSTVAVGLVGVGPCLSRKGSSFTVESVTEERVAIVHVEQDEEEDAAEEETSSSFSVLLLSMTMGDGSAGGLAWAVGVDAPWLNDASSSVV